MRFPSRNFASECETTSLQSGGGGEEFRQSLFLGFVNGTPGSAALSNDAHGRISYFERPVGLEIASIEGGARAEHEVSRRAVTKQLIDWAHADRLALEISIPDFRGPTLQPAAKALLSQGAWSEPDYRGHVDLFRSDESLFKSLRKSTRQRVRASKSLLEAGTELVDASSAVDKRMQELQEFHYEVAGRVTRPNESWVVMADEIRSGAAEAIFCRLDGRLVAATFVRFGKWVAEAGTSVYARDRFDVPLGHWPKWLSIVRAKQLGLWRFLFTNLYPHTATSPEKLQHIAMFKRGFASDIEIAMNFGLAAPENKRPAGLGR